MLGAYKVVEVLEESWLKEDAWAQNDLAVDAP